jgi:hypothetical protein
MPVATGSIVAPSSANRGRTRRVRNPLPTDYVESVVADKRWLINLTKDAWTIQRTHGSYHIPGIKEGQSYASLEITGRTEVTDDGNDFGTEMLNLAPAIAEDLFNQINNGIVMDADAPAPFLGVFVSETPKPSRERLEEERDRLMEFGAAVVKQGDQFWDDPRNHVMITDFHRRFAKMRNEKRPWMFESKSLTPCPACSHSIPPGLAKCPQCHAVLDMAKMKQFFPLEYAELQQLNELNSEKKAKTPKEN